MFERFTDRARRVLNLSQEEARLLNHDFIGTEHLLLGLIHEGEGVAAKALGALGITLQAARQKVEDTVGVPTNARSGSPPFTPRAKKVLELSLREALQLGHSYIGTEHLLLGLVREGEGMAAQVLVSLGADLGRVRQQVIQLMSGYGGPGPAEAPGPPGARPGFARRRTGATPPWLRCSLCGRSLWETAHVVVGPGGRACEECVRAGAGLLQGAGTGESELVLPPKVVGQPPDDAAVAAITTAVTRAFGPDAGPSAWATTVEDPEHVVPLLQHLHRRRGRPEAVQVAEIGFVNPDLAYVRFQLELGGRRGADVSGQLRRHGERWLVTTRTLAEMRRRAGVPTDFGSGEPEVVGTPPDDRAVDQITEAITTTFDPAERGAADPSDHLEEARALAPYLDQGAERYPAGLHPTWVRHIRFTGPDTAVVLFTGNVAGIQPSFEGTVRRHGDRWMVTRETMVAVLARGGIVVPPPAS